MTKEPKLHDLNWAWLEWLTAYPSHLEQMNTGQHLRQKMVVKTKIKQYIIHLPFAASEHSVTPLNI